jgi:hypothetical protein
VTVCMCTYFWQIYGPYFDQKYVHIRAARICTYNYKYVHIRSYTYSRCPQQGVSICTYSLEIHSHTAPVNPTYGSLEIKYVHIRSVYERIRTCTYVIRRVTIRSAPYVVRIMHVFASINVIIRSHTADRMLIYTYAYTCIYVL